jgi:hypothetical protein
MICYQDRTFCRGDGCANRTTCSRWATDPIRIAANKHGLPLALFTDHHLLECYKPEPTKESKP